MNKEQEFRTRIREYFHKQDSSLEKVLSSLISYEYPDEVVILEFVIFPDGFRSGFPVRVFFMDTDVCEVFVYKDGEAEYPSPVDPGLLEIPFLYPRELEKKYESEDFDIWSAASDELILWFSERWKASGGSFFKKAAIIMEHDDIRAFSLNSFQWVEDN